MVNTPNSESEYSQILRDVENYINKLYNSSNSSLLYHNLNHTKDVVNATTEIAGHYKLNSKDILIVTVAAWFHDIGYLNGKHDHEKVSAAYASNFLNDLKLDQDIVESVQSCIMATVAGSSPVTQLHKIIKDADLYHLGTEQFKDKYKLLWKELKATGVDMSKEEWRKQTIALLRRHRYYTEYCQKKLEQRKADNLGMLETGGEHMKERINVDAPVKSQAEKVKPNKGIETMFRLASTNSQCLSDQADNKANILITVNSIIISVLLGTVVRRLDIEDNLTMPSLILLVVSLSTIAFAILATVPRVPSGVFTQKDLDNKNVNLLFFGNFYRMKFDDYAQGMLKVMDDKNFLYLSLIRDVYGQAVVLGRKFKMLKIAYYIFMVGLAISVLSFFIASKYYAK